MCDTIVLNNGTKWKTLGKATSDDIASDKMVLICPRCNIAYVVQAELLGRSLSRPRSENECTVKLVLEVDSKRPIHLESSQKALDIKVQKWCEEKSVCYRSELDSWARILRTL